MESIIGDYDSAISRLKEPNSALYSVKHTINALIPFQYMGNFNSALHKTVTDELGIFDVGLQGVPVAYNEKTAKFKQKYGSFISVHPYIHCKIECEYVLFSPKLGDVLQGVVNKVEKDMVGCLIHGCFYAAVRAGTEELAGIQMEDYVTFTVTKLEDDNGVLSITGQLLDFETNSTKNRNNSDSGLETPTSDGTKDVNTTNDSLIDAASGTLDPELQDVTESKKKHKKEKKKKSKKKKEKKAKREKRKHHITDDSQTDVLAYDQTDPRVAPLDVKDSAAKNNAKMHYNDTSLKAWLLSSPSSDNCLQLDVSPSNKKTEKCDLSGDKKFETVISSPCENESLHVSPGKQKRSKKLKDKIAKQDVHNEYDSSQKTASGLSGVGNLQQPATFEASCISVDNESTLTKTGVKRKLDAITDAVTDVTNTVSNEDGPGSKVTNTKLAGESLTNSAISNTSKRKTYMSMDAFEKFLARIPYSLEQYCNLPDEVEPESPKKKRKTTKKNTDVDKTSVAAVSELVQEDPQPSSNPIISSVHPEAQVTSKKRKTASKKLDTTAVAAKPASVQEDPQPSNNPVVSTVLPEVKATPKKRKTATKKVETTAVAAKPGLVQEDPQPSSNHVISTVLPEAKATPKKRKSSHKKVDSTATTSVDETVQDVPPLPSDPSSIKPSKPKATSKKRKTTTKMLNSTAIPNNYGESAQVVTQLSKSTVDSAKPDATLEKRDDGANLACTSATLQDGNKTPEVSEEEHHRLAMYHLAKLGFTLPLSPINGSKLLDLTGNGSSLAAVSNLSLIGSRSAVSELPAVEPSVLRTDFQAMESIVKEKKAKKKHKSKDSSKSEKKKSKKKKKHRVDES